MLDQCIMSLALRRKMQKEFLVIVVFSLSDIWFLNELYQTIHEVLVNFIRVNEEWLDEPVSFVRLQRQFFVLIVVKHYLENTLLFQCFVLILLILRFKCIDWTIEFLLGKCLRIYSRGPENNIIGNFEGLGDNLEYLSLTRADWTNDCYSFLPSHVFNDTKIVILLLFRQLKLHGIDNFVKSLFNIVHEILFILLSFGCKVQLGCRWMRQSSLWVPFGRYWFSCFQSKRIRCVVFILVVVCLSYRVFFLL